MGNVECFKCDKRPPMRSDIVLVLKYFYKNDID